MPNYVVRYGVMRLLGVFSTGGGIPYPRGMSVIARTDRGLEEGEVLCEATPEALASLPADPGAFFLREMTGDDRHELTRIRGQAPQQHATCQCYIEKLGLAMQLVNVEQIFGGERLVVYYLAESRVDFRELVRQLAGEFQTRIEMRQIGVRDEANSWPTTAIAACPCAAIITWWRCRPSPCGWPNCRRPRWTPRRFPDVAGG